MPPTARTLPSDDAVSEVLGAILAFGVTSVIVVVAMIGFNGVQQETAEKTIAVEALAIADRVVADMSAAASFIERHPEVTEYEHHFEFPPSLEGHGYRIRYDGSEQRIYVDVTANRFIINSTHVVPLPTGLEWCEGPNAPGHSVRILFQDSTGCPSPGVADALLLVRTP